MTISIGERASPLMPDSKYLPCTQPLNGVTIASLLPLNAHHRICPDVIW